MLLYEVVLYYVMLLYEVVLYYVMLLYEVVLYYASRWVRKYGLVWE